MLNAKGGDLEERCFVDRQKRFSVNNTGIPGRVSFEIIENKLAGASDAESVCVCVRFRMRGTPISHRPLGIVNPAVQLRCIPKKFQ